MTENVTTDGGQNNGTGQTACEPTDNETLVVNVGEDATTWSLPNGELHRENGPAIEYANGTWTWYHYGKLHRENGPAFKGDDGSYEWHQHGHLHREDGPAIDRVDGLRAWYQHGLRHRIGGPASEYPNEHRLWWLWGLEATEEDSRRAETLDSETLMVAEGLAKDWEDSVTSLLDTAVLLAQ